MVSEVWRAIPGHPRYETSDQGRVRSLDTRLDIGPSGNGRNNGHTRMRKGRVLRLQHHRNGYLTILLHPMRRVALVQRLVCLAFHGEPPAADSHADHINSVRSDNRAENLRWLAPEANRELRDLARGERSGATNLTAAHVQEIYLRSQRAIGVTRSDEALAAKFSVSRETIRNIRRGTTWSHLTKRVRRDETLPEGTT